ncbi:MAG: hypothetical protein ACRELF_01010, partial [Gemmataceae bacterium]
MLDSDRAARHGGCVERAGQPRCVRSAACHSERGGADGSAIGVKIMPSNSVRCTCPNCRNQFSVPQTMVGRKGTCPKCRTPLIVKATGGKVVLTLAGVSEDVRSETLLAAPSAKTNDAQRSWAGTVFALLALMLALAAMPASVIHHPLLGAGLATLGLTLALFAVLTCLFRRGIGLALIALLVGGTALFSVVALAGGAANLLQPVKDRLAVPRPQDVKQEVEELAVTQKQPENEGTQPKKESDERRNDGKGQVKETASQHSQRDEEQPAQREPAQKPSRKEQKDAKVLPNQADGNTNPLGITFSPPKLVPPPLPRPAAHDKPAPKPPPPASLEQPRTATQKVDERLQVDAEKRAAAEREKQRWLAVEQRMRAGEEELRKQLVAVPELRLVNDLDVQALHKNAQALRKNAKSQSVIVDLHQYLVKAGIQAGLPVRAGAQAYLQPSAAMVVEQLSKSLRD